MSERVQRAISKTTQLQTHQWIYDVAAQPDEEIFLNQPEWLLAKDKHPGADTRYLIIFKDRELQTMRDLRTRHVTLLMRVCRESHKILASIMHCSVKDIQKDWRIYFHYYPSVFQLHAHIVNDALHRNADRVHELRHVVRNLLSDSLWYKHATILCTQTRFVQEVLNERYQEKQVHWLRIANNLLRIELNFGFRQKQIPKDPVEIDLPAAGDGDNLPSNVSDVQHNISHN